MSRFLKEIFFNSVLIVILLHTFIPHLHADQMTKNEHIDLHNNSNSLYNLLKIALHENDNENLDHLIVAQYDVIKKTKTAHQYLIIAIQNSNPSGIEKIAIGKIVKRNIDNFNKLFIVKLNGVRGPPFIV